MTRPNRPGGAFWKERGIKRPRRVQLREGPRSIPVREARGLVVRANLATSVAMQPPWGLMLDGLLLAAAYRRQDAVHGRRSDAHEWVSEPGLPLVRVFKQRWVWASSSALVVGDAGEDVLWRHRRFRALRSFQVSSRVPSKPEEAGRFRGMRMPVVTTVCRALEWRVLGDPEGIRSLLDDIVSLGDDRSRGCGEVLSWEIEDQGSAESFVEARDWFLWTPDGSISRPVDVRHAAELGLDRPETIRGTYRPPYWRPMWNQPWAEVIAPWTTKP